MKKAFSLLIAVALALFIWLPTAHAQTYYYGSSIATTVGATGTNADHFIGNGSWKNNQAASYVEMYLDLSQFGTFTIDQIDYIKFATKKGTLESTPDFYAKIYTVGTLNGWYNYQLNAEPYFSNSLNAPANQWNKWTTDAVVNQLTFFDRNVPGVGFGFYGQPDLQDLQAAAINWNTYSGLAATTSIDYGAEVVKYIVMGTGSGWNSTFDGLLDQIIISVNGTEVTWDLEGSMPEVWVDDDWVGSTAGAVVGGTHVFGNDAFATITNGINAVIAGGTVNVAAGTYGEIVNVNKSVTLLGAQANVTPVTGGRSGGETIIQGGGDPAWGPLHTGNQINITVDNVEVNGFEFNTTIAGIFTNRNGTGTHSNVKIKYNYIHPNSFSSPTVYSGIVTAQNVSAWTPPTPALILNNYEISYNLIPCSVGPKAIALSGAVTYNDLNISHNDISCSTPNASGIFAGGGQTVTHYNNTVIKNNNFHDIAGTAIQIVNLLNADISDNIFTNVGSGAFVSMDGGKFVDNTISGLAVTNGYGLKLVGDPSATIPLSKNVEISGNSFAYNDNVLFPDTKGLIIAADVNGTQWVNAASLTVQNNSFLNAGAGTSPNLYAIQNLASATLPATCNWFGTSNATLIAPMITGSVTYAPFNIAQDGPCSGVLPIFTTIGTPTSLACGTIDVPFTVNNFNAVGAISLVLNYDPAVLSYQSVTLNPAIPTDAANGAISGKFILGKFFVPAISLNDNDVLFTLHFNLLPVASGSTTTLSWSTVSGNNEYAGPGGEPVYSASFVDLPWTIPTRPVKNTTTLLEYCAIQAAIDDPLTLATHTIEVSPGIYPEQVTINKSIKLTGTAGAMSTTIIQAPPTLPAASDMLSNIVLVNSGVNAEITGLTISGPGPTACGSMGRGIFVRDGAYANIHNNQILDIRDNVFSGCQNGIAIQVGRQAYSTNGSATIENNIITGYQKGAIVVDNTGSNAIINGNTITGAGTTAVTAQNGIQISRGATATLNGNTITGNSFHIDGNTWDWGAAGILLYQSGAVSLTGGNNLSGNDQNYYVSGPTGIISLGAEIFGTSTAPVTLGYNIINLSNHNLDATNCTFAGISPASAGLSDLYNIEDRIWHSADDQGYTGFVRVKTDNVYVTHTETGAKIKYGIDAATPGDIVNVKEATYAETILVDKSLIIKGANAGTPCYGTRVAESIIVGSGDAAITVAADGVTIDGFEITNPSENLGIASAGYSVLLVQNNKIHDIGTSGTPGNAQAVNIMMSNSADITNVKILQNCISNINNTDNTGASGCGVYVGNASANYDITGLEIASNMIDHVWASPAAYGSGGRGAYGILINVGANGGASGKATSPIISCNTISNLNGLWATGVGLEGETPSAQVKNNDINNLTGNISPANPAYATGVKVEDNAGASTVVITDNSFTAMGIGIQNAMAAVTVNGEGNWWGTTGPIPALVSGLVDWTPFLDAGGSSSSAPCFTPTGNDIGCVAMTLAETHVNLTCNASLNGSIDLSVTGGVAPFTYAWTSILGYTNTSEDISGLAADTYTVVVTDGNLCTQTISVVILEPSTYAFSYTVPSPICPNVTVVVPVTFATVIPAGLGFNGVIFKFEGSGPGNVIFGATDSQNHYYSFTNSGYWGPPSGFTLPANHSATTPFDVKFTASGSYTITFSLVDAATNNVICGITESVTATVNEDVTLTCPSNITVNSDPGMCGALVPIEATATGTAPVTFVYKIGTTEIASPYLFPGGTTIVDVTATNTCGSKTCSFTVTVGDNQAPVTASNGSSTVECLTAALAPVVPTASDNCDGTIASIWVSTVDDPGTLTCEGSRVYTYSYTDVAGNVSNWTYTYTIDHTILPTEIGGPVAIASTVECESDAMAPTTLPVVQDICGNEITPAAPVKQLSFTNKFDAAVVIGPTAAPGVWYTDRYAPAGFATASFDGGNRLKHSIAAADFQGNPSFYSTQGRGYVVGTATNSMEVKLFIPLAWKTSNKRMAGLWGVAVDVSNAVSGYPIVEFTSDGGVPRFRVWESNGTNNWVNLGLPAGFAYDTWITLKIRLLPSGEFLLSAGSLSYLTNTSAPDASVRLKSVILQGHNYDPSNTSVGVTYDIYWDNFTYNDTYASGMCEGAIAYTYDYADCSGLPYAWTYTYTVDHVTAPVVPSDGALTVECLSSAATPATPVVADVCGANVPAVLVSTVDSPELLVCEGTRTYNYTYTDCSGLVSNWKYVYTIAHTTNPSVFTPAPTSGGTVECVASATAPATLPVVKDVCGNTLTPTVASPVMGGTYTTCQGTRTYTYNYVDCSGLPYAWTYTYNIEHTTAPIVPAPGASTVACLSNAVAPLSVLTCNPPYPPTSYAAYDCMFKTYMDAVLDQSQTTFASYVLDVNTGVGQSFTPSVSGLLTQIDVNIYEKTGNPSFILKVYAGDGISGTPIYSSGGYSITSTGWITIPITGTQPTLTAGTQYTFWLTAYPYNSVRLSIGSNAYAGGVCYDACEQPVVTDVCGTVIPTPTPLITGTYNGCSGTRIYTYTYTDCAGLSSDWVYTYTISAPVVSMPAAGGSIVACPALAVEPTPPTVTDNCGRTLSVSAGIEGTTPSCNGIKTWTFTYTDCANATYTWVYTYTISAPVVTMPDPGGSTVACPALATLPTPPTVTDNCGRTLSVSAGVLGILPTCSGTMTYTFTYTDCANATYTWVYTYTISAPVVSMPADGGSTVACPIAAVAPTPPTVTDNCGRTLSVSAGIEGTTPSCNGTKTWTFTYTDCANATYTWVYTYTITYAGALTPPANGASTVSGPAQAVNPVPPANITDACGRTVIPALVGSTTPPACDGSVVWTYRYTACDGTTTADWTYTYTIIKSTLSGKLTYNNPANTPMNNVKLKLVETGAEFTTLTDGSYTFAGLCPGTYTIAVTTNTKLTGGINSTDAGAANYWSTHFSSIEHVKFMAGDVSNENFIEASDALKIQRYFVFNESFSRSPWSYWKKGDMVQSNYIPNPIPTTFSVTVAGNVFNYDMYAMCTGDFNGSFTPGGTKSASSSLTLALDGNLLAGPGQSLELPIRAASSMEVGAVSLILSIPSNLVEIAGVKVNGSDVPVTYTVNGNELRIGWNSVTPVYTPAGGNLLTLKLRTREAFTEGQSIALSLMGNPLNELADGSFTAIDNADLLISIVDNLATGINHSDANKLALSNYPNPFIHTTTVSYTIPVDGKVVLDVYTLLGQHVATLVDANQTAGTYTLEFNGESMQQGIYSVRLRLSSEKGMLERSGKFVIQQK